ncbi:hypothetical protein ABZ092_38790 [Streptomyces bobili]|uniref:hypothetical protein n=1 Tax=Streptomyces bobili TaxID=67280 RepID=UPI0033B1AD50
MCAGALDHVRPASRSLCRGPLSSPSHAPWGGDRSPRAAQQIGGALGLAVLSTVSTSAADDKLPDAAAGLYRALETKDLPLSAKAGEALTHGYTLAFVAAAVMFLAGLVVTFLAVDAGRQRHTEGAAPVHLG